MLPQPQGKVHLAICISAGEVHFPVFIPAESLNTLQHGFSLILLRHWPVCPRMRIFGGENKALL